MVIDPRSLLSTGIQNNKVGSTQIHVIIVSIVKLNSFTSKHDFLKTENHMSFKVTPTAKNLQRNMNVL